MKKLSFLTAVLFLFVACAKTDEQKIVKNISEYYKMDAPDTTGTGDLVYKFEAGHYDKSTYKFIYDEPFVMEPKIKGAVDRALETLPIKQRDRYFSRFQEYFIQSYEWETLKTKVIMESHFPTAPDTNTLYLFVKIWITNK